MKYSLNIGERFEIMQLMPQEADLMTMQDIADLRHNLIPTPAERAALGVVTEKDERGKTLGYTWAEETAEVEAEIDFTTPQVALTVNALRKLAEDKKMRLEHLSLYKKFVGGTQ